MPPAANGRSYAIRSVRHTANPEEKINRVIAIAAGLPMWMIAVVARIRPARATMAVHWIGAI